MMSPMKRALNLLLTLTLLTATANGTTIVILRTPQEIVAAADSKRVTIGDDPPTPISCKIYCLKNRCEAMSGLPVILGDHKVIFDGHALAKDALRQGENLQEVLAIFEKSVLKDLHLR